MHKNEFSIDEALVLRLLQDQFPHFSHLPLRRVTSTGTDNALYRLGNEMVVRLPRIDWAIDSIHKEATWLPQLAPFLPVSIPLLIGKGSPIKEYPCPWAIYEWIEGRNPCASDISSTLVHDLSAFIQAMHKVNLPNGPTSNRGIPLELVDNKTRNAIKQLDEKFDANTIIAIWEKALKSPQWSEPPVWIHADLSAGNILIQKGRLNAVIDFGMLGTGDPACDLIIAWNLLTAESRKVFRETLGVDDFTWERGKGWALSIALIALPYYKETNPTLAQSADRAIKELILDYKNIVN